MKSLKILVLVSIATVSFSAFAGMRTADDDRLIQSKLDQIKSDGYICGERKFEARNWDEGTMTSILTCTNSAGLVRTARITLRESSPGSRCTSFQSTKIEEISEKK